MPALPADIAAASRDVVVASWADAAIAARYPSSRDGSLKPATGFFDAIADALTVATARGNLIGTERRRFSVLVADVLLPTVSTGLPQVRLIDAEQSANLPCVVARIEIDLEAETTSYELFG